MKNSLCSLIKCSNCCRFSLYDSKKIVDWIKENDDEKVRSIFGIKIYEDIKNTCYKKIVRYFKKLKKKKKNKCYLISDDGCMIHPEIIGEEIRPEGSSGFLCSAARTYDENEKARNFFEENKKFLKKLFGEKFYIFNNHRLTDASIFIKQFMKEDVNKELYVENKKLIESYLINFDFLYKNFPEKALLFNERLKDLLL